MTDDLPAPVYDISTCYLDPEQPITPENYHQPPVLCGSLYWSSATADRRKVTCWSCSAALELEGPDLP